MTTERFRCSASG